MGRLIDLKSHGHVADKLSLTAASMHFGARMFLGPVMAHIRSALFAGRFRIVAVVSFFHKRFNNSAIGKRDVVRQSASSGSPDCHDEVTVASP